MSVCAWQTKLTWQVREPMRSISPSWTLSWAVVGGPLEAPCQALATFLGSHPLHWPSTLVLDRTRMLTGRERITILVGTVAMVQQGACSCCACVMFDHDSWASLTLVEHRVMASEVSGDAAALGRWWWHCAMLCVLGSWLYSRYQLCSIHIADTALPFTVLWIICYAVFAP